MSMNVFKGVVVTLFVIIVALLLVVVQNQQPNVQDATETLQLTMMSRGHNPNIPMVRENAI